MIGLIKSSLARAHIVCALASFSLAACTFHSTEAADAALPTCANPAPLYRSIAAIPGKFIVGLKDAVKVDDFANRVAASDVTVKSKMNRLRMLEVEATDAAIARLRCDVDVEAISSDEPTIAN
jgi:hypothetical protein